MERIKVVWWTVAMLSTLGSCATEKWRPIPDGTYFSPSGEETVSIRGPQIHFRVRVGDGIPPGFGHRTYEYHVSKGQIIAPMNDIDAGTGVGRDDWIWDGEVIIRRYRDSAQSVRFVRQPTPTPPPGPCWGDCARDGTVTVNEIVVAVNLALGVGSVNACAMADRNRDHGVTIDEVIAAVDALLRGCDPERTG